MGNFFFHALNYSCTPTCRQQLSYVRGRRTHSRLRATIATHEVGRARNCTRLSAGHNYSLQLHTCRPRTTTIAHFSLATHNYNCTCQPCNYSCTCRVSPSVTQHLVRWSTNCAARFLSCSIYVFYIYEIISEH